MREEIGAAALEKFLARGYSVGVKDITDAAGAPKGSFYNHFDSKESMGLEALARYTASLRMEMLADESVPPLERLRRHFERLTGATAARGYARGCLYGNFAAEVADHSEAIRAGVEAGLDDWARLVAAAIAQAQRDGSVRPGLDPGVTARFVLNAFEGALLGARAARTGESFDAFFATVFGVVLTPQ
jgi:TetR/AcrR family transcriptional regulator, transcriptional repressor for nem operon